MSSTPYGVGSTRDGGAPRNNIVKYFSRKKEVTWVTQDKENINFPRGESGLSNIVQDRSGTPLVIKTGKEKYKREKVGAHMVVG